MTDAPRPMEPEILAGHIDLASEALDGLAFQSSAAARFLQRGEIPAAIEAYRRCVKLHRDFASPNMRTIALATAGDEKASAESPT